MMFEAWGYAIKDLGCACAVTGYSPNRQTYSTPGSKPNLVEGLGLGVWGVWWRVLCLEMRVEG